MKKHKLFAALAAIFLVTSVNADDCNTCDPCEITCDMCDPCGGWSVELDWLYWHLRRCELTYATTGSDDHLYVKSVDLSYDNGLRLGVFKECGDVNFGIRYTRYCYDDSQTVIDTVYDVKPARSGNVFINSEIAINHYDFDMDVFELESRYALLDDCDSSAWAFAGFRYASIDQKLKTLYGADATDVSGSGELNAILVVSERNDMDGYGLYLGAASNFSAFSCLDVYGSFSIGTMIAEFERDYKVIVKYEGETEVTQHWSDDCYKILTNLDFAVGVGYDLCDICCVDWSLTLGYEFHHWMNTLDFILAETDGDIFEIDRHSEDLGFDGLFVRLTGTF